MGNLLDLWDWIGITMSNMASVVSSFFDYGEQIVVGVSGGADSIALIHCLKNSSKNFNLIALHINHCLRGDESFRDENFVLNFCLENDIYFISKRIDILKLAKEKKISLEECGREQRYRFLERFGCTIATAHNLSDLCETFFLNILRGCGLKGLTSIPKKRGKIIRPLLSFTKKEILEYCKTNNLDFVEDSTNFKEEFLRNRVRINIMPKFKEIDENFEFSFLKTIENIKHDEEYLDFVSNREFKNAFFKNGLRVAYLNKLHKSIKTRVIIKFLEYNNFSLKKELINRIYNLCSKGVGKQHICLNRFLVVKKGVLLVEEENCSKSFKIEFPNYFEFSYKNLYFIRCDASRYNYFLNKTNYLFLFKFDYDKIVGRIYIKSREPKDRLKLLDRPTKTIKALMQEKRMLKNEKDRTVLLSDEIGVFWAFGFGGDFRVFPDEKTKKLCLVFEKI